MVLRLKAERHEVFGPMNLDSQIVSGVHKELEGLEKSGARHGPYEIQTISLV